MFDYSWFKVGADTFNDPKIKIIEAEEDSDTIICIWFKSLCLARIVNDSGYLYINGETPYTLKTLAIEFNRPLDKVKAAIKVLRRLQMIEFTEYKYYRVKNWTKYQNVDALEKQRAETSRRVAKHRAKKKLETKNPDDNNNGENNSAPNEENNNGSVNENSDEMNENKDDGTLQNDKALETKGSGVTIEDNENKNDNNSTDGSEINSNVTCNTENLEFGSNVTKENKVTENICNDSVTDNNVTVTDKIKRENESKNKTQKKKESECNNDSSLNESCVRIVNYYESITGIVGTLNIGTLKLSIDMHGEKYVKLAIQKAIECGKTNITYINGILKNWKREGYPSEKEEVKDNGGKRNNKGNTADKNEFAGFKPKKPKHLTEEQRKKIEADLI
ncbi:MAG: phage replisome organizer N-terminal domain-containing protein [Clostridium sp.]|nr:phage replisome organizer N-terminal domain-containing protein [Clostridium sp.]